VSRFIICGPLLGSIHSFTFASFTLFFRLCQFSGRQIALFGHYVYRTVKTSEKGKVSFTPVLSAEQLAELESDPDFIRIISGSRQRPRYEIASEFTGHQTDEWHIIALDKIVVHSHITLTRWPEETAFMEITLPYASGVMESATFGDTELQYDDITKGKYKLELPQDWISLAEKKIEIVWTLPLETLEKVDLDYQTVLRSLISVYSYSLTTVLEADNGFEYTKDPSKQEFVPFTWNSHKANRDFGSCGLTIQKVEID